MSKTVYEEPKTMYEICSWDKERINTLVVYAESDKSLWVEAWSGRTVRQMRKHPRIFGNLTTAQEGITITLLNNVKRIEENLTYAKNYLANWRSLLASDPNAGLKSK